MKSAFSGMSLGVVVGTLEAALLHFLSGAPAALGLYAMICYGALGAAVAALAGWIRHRRVGPTSHQVDGVGPSALSATWAVLVVVETWGTGLARGWDHQLATFTGVGDHNLVGIGALVVIFFAIGGFSQIVLGRLARGRGFRWLCRITYGAGGVCAVGTAILAVTAQAEARHPNILLLVMDTARADRLSCYGCERTPPTSPNLDALAAEGVRYTRAIAQSTWTLPSHASLFTGLYASQHGATEDSFKLRDRFVTLAELLQSRGYRTAGFSNNHIFVNRRFGFAQGFEEWHTLEDASLEQVRDFKVNAIRRTYSKPTLRLFSIFTGGAPSTGPWTPEQEAPVADEGAQATTIMTQRWLHAHGRDEEPFFLFLNFMEPHTPYDAPPEFLARYLPPGMPPTPVFQSEEEADLWSFLVGEKRDFSNAELQIRRKYALLGSRAGLFEVSNTFRAAIEARYDAQIAYLDNQIGRVIDKLRELEILDDTLVIVTSDHGEHLGEGGRWKHQESVHHVLAHVPLIVRHPTFFPGGQTEDGLVELVDLFPTIAQILGGEPDRDRNERKGHSLLEPPLSDRTAMTQLGFSALPTLEAALDAYDKNLLDPRWPQPGETETGPAAAEPDPKPEYKLASTADKDAWIQKNAYFIPDAVGALVEQARHMDRSTPQNEERFQHMLRQLGRELDVLKDRIAVRTVRWNVRIALYEGAWKYIWETRDPRALYQANPPGGAPRETEDLAEKEPDQAAALYQQLLRLMAGLTPSAGYELPILTQEHKEKAAALGYTK